MARIRTEQNNLVGGVSQQPAPSRLPNQAEEMVNFWPSPVDGLVRRMPTEHIKDLGAVPAVARYHTVYRDATEQYQLVVTPAGLTAFDLSDGSSATINDPGGVGFGYLSTATDQEHLRLLTVADTTFVVNTQVPVEMRTVTSSSLGEEGFIFLRQGNYKSTYTVKVFYGGGSSATLSTSTYDGTAAVGLEISSIKTEDIIADLATKLTGVGFTTVQSGSVLKISRAGPTAIDAIETEDSVGDTALAALHLEVPRVEGWLPEICEDGFRVKVVGDAEVDSDDYWVAFKANDQSGGGFGRGVWEETLAPDTESILDAATMPHVLISTGVGTFDWVRPDWGDRTVGDSDSNPDPSFVDATIRNLFFYKNRLGVLSGPNVILSETGEFFNFFRATLLSLRDTARIDVASNHTRVSLFESAAPYNEDMLLFTDRTQFILKGAEILSPRTVQIVPVSEFESSVRAQPVPTARSVFFPFQRGEQSGVRELFQVGDITNFDGADVTAQVPNYVQGTIELLVGSALENTLLCLTDQPSQMYLYKYLWSGQERAQAAWGIWDFGDDVLHFEFVQNTIFFLFNRGGQILLESLTLATGLSDPGQDWIVHLDRRISEVDLVSAIYDPVEDETVLTIPYDSGFAEYAVVDRDTGVTYEVVDETGTTVTIRGDVSTTDLWIGTKYLSSYTFTLPLVRHAAGNGTIARYDDPQQVAIGHLQFNASRYFEVSTKVGNRAARTRAMTGLRPDLPEITLDGIVLTDGEFSFGVAGAARDSVVVLSNDTPYPSNVSSASWEINYTPRSSRFQG